MIRTITFFILQIVLIFGVHAQNIIFADNFEKDTINRFPNDWLSNAPGEITTIRKYPGKWLRLHAPGTYVPQINQTFPKEFVFEFDFIFLKENDSYNTTEIALFSDQDSLPFDNLFPGKCGLKINIEDYIVSYISYDHKMPGKKLSGENRLGIIQENVKARISVAIQQDSAHISVNGTEVLTAPIFGEDNINMVRFHLWGSQAEPLIGNLSLAENRKRKIN